MKNQNPGKNRILSKVVIILIVISLLSGNTLKMSYAKAEEPPEEYRGETFTSVGLEGSAAVIQEESFGIAWGDPDGPHSVYDWPFTFQQMGLVIQSYQNYSSGTSSAYFHHGIDMIAPNGTQVYTRSGGQVVNVENYQPGNSLYWEVAILDDEGYVWQYHHIDEPTIPDLIYQKFAEWQADPVNGGFVPPNTHIGNIIYWPVVSLGYRFNHIHLNILAAGDVYLNGLEFHTPLVDNQIPEIQEIGLLNGDTVISGNTASGNYGMYVRARDLMMSPVYYLPPHKTEFSIDGGEWVTVWEFHNFPGGFDDHLYVNDFYVPVYTKGDYNYRDFYIDLGFTTEGQRAFPSEPGEHNIEVCVWDYYSNYTCDTFSWNVVTAIPDNGCGSGNGVTRTFQVTEDLLVTDVNLGVNLSHASRGQVRVTLKSPTDTTATTIINTSSDTYDNYDMWVDDSSGNPVNDGNNDIVDAPYFDRIVGPSTNGALDSFNGESAFGEWTVFICDNVGGTTGAVNLIDLEVIGVVSGNEAPTADDQNVSTNEDTSIAVTLTGSDPDDNPLTFSIVDGPTSGSLSGTAPDLTYTPNSNYYGTDSFTFKANDGFADSELATVSITIASVNDVPVAQDQSVSTEVNVPVAIELAGLDVDGDSLSFTVLTDPEYGSLSGTAPSLQYTPITGYTGSDSFTYSVSDGELDSEIATISITITPPGPVQIFWDDFESDLGWVVNPYNNDAATTGVWERANPEGTDSSGSVMQLGETISGTNNLVTGALAGSSVGSYDIDGGDTTILSPEITLTGGRELTLSFYYYLAHLNNATADDYLRVSVLGETSQLVFEELGEGNTDIATWESYSADISSFSGQTIRLLIEAADSGTASLVEAAIDDVLIQGLMTNNPPVADSQSVVTEEDMAVGVTLSGSDPEGSPLTYTLVTQPLHGNLSGTAPDLTYTPAANFNGSDSFTFKVNDGETDSNIATVSISVTPVNDAPIANGQSVSTEEDTAKGIALTGTDVDGNPLTYTIVTQPKQGNLSGDAPNVTYTPAANYNGTDSFTFKVNDGSVDSDIAMVTITVSAVNDVPIADSQSVNMAEDTTTAITLTGSDVESSQLTYYIVTSPAHGTLSGTAPDLTYTPAANYNGSDSFTFKANDGQTDSAPATVSITITPVNDAPIATPQNIGTTQDTAVSITLSGSDIDGDTLTYAVSAPPTHGTLSGTVPNLTFTPNSGYVGADSFEFTVNDGSVTSSPATISISISNINDAPVADGQTLSTPEDTSLSITLSGSDVDNDPLTYRVITEPAHGTLTGDEPALTYMPAENYHGTDSFTFIANDGVVDSVPATVAITIEPVNDAPVADEQAVVTSEDTAVEIHLTGTDVEGSELTFSLETDPDHGTLSGTGASRLYTPDPGFEGEDTFTFIANDGELDSEPATVSITVNRTNEPPVADEQTVSTNEDVALGVTLTGSDPDGDPITYVVSANPSHGTLSGTAPNLTYTPQENYYGPDSFRFIVNDGLGDSAEAIISITIIPVNDAPVSEPQSVNVIEDTATTVTLSGSDIDGDNLTFMVETGPNHGNLSGTGQDLTYTPAANYNGSDSFTFKVNDGTVDSNIATVSITVTPVNDTPVANGQVVSTAEDTAKGIILTGTDVDGNPLTYSIITSPGHGTLSGSAPNVTYTPDANYNGSDSFTFGVSDGQANSAPATVSISISAVNDAPVAVAQTLTVDEDATLNVLLAGLDVDGDGLTFAVVTGPTHGNLSGTVPNLVYAPISNFNGSDTFTFTVSDGTLVSAPAAIEISIRPVNDLPVAEGQEVTTNENAPVTITLVGSDIDGDDLDYIIESAPLFGGLTGTAPNLVYTPNEYYSGTDVFSFYVNDGISNSNSAEVTILILDINYLPIVYNQTVSTNENSPLAIILAGMDPDGDALNFFTKSLPAHGVLSGTAPNLVYTPNPGYTGSDSFTFAASDQEGESNEGVISIQVTPSGPLTVFFDDFETDLGWVRNAFGTDTASLGWFERANPESVSYYGDKQLGTTVSGSYDLVTGPLAGSSAGSYDLDGGKTSFLSPEIELPTGRDLEMSFSYYVAHYTNSSTADYLRVFIIGEDTVTIFEELGANNDDDAVWEVFSGEISNFAGQTIQILIEAADASTASLFEAAVDDILILATTPNNPPVAEEQSYETAEDEDLEIILAGSDPNGDEISFRIESSPSHGSLSGTSPNLVYSPDSDYNGSDSFTYVVNDGKLDSEPATVFISVRAVNDAPIAIAQTLSTQVDVPVSIILSGTDAEGDNLTFSLITQPTNGILSGAAPDLVYTPAVGFTGTDSFQFTVNDGILASSPAVVSIEVNPAGPMTIFWDDFETDQGWVFDPFGTDTATVGTFERANPESVYYYGYKQLGTTVSGSYDLVTGPLYGRSAGDYDLDGGVTMISSPIISLPTGREITLSFSYYFAHASNSSTSDYLRVKIIGSTTTTLFQELGANNDDDASWQTFSVSLNDFAGQTVYLLIEAADASTASLVEAAIDDVLIVAE